jgi:cob(I)alamin adenosyltransferase
MKIYTRTGDDGTTGLLGASRVPKHDARVEAYGCVDELNAVLGVARALDGGRLVDAQLERLQESLFQLGAELAATDAKVLATLSRVSDEDVAALESAIDRLEADLPPLTRFILPGGSPLAAHLHFARTVCRRAERRVTQLATRDPIEPRLVRWLNRLADLLFVMARWVNLREGRKRRRGSARGAPSPRFSGLPFRRRRAHNPRRKPACMEGACAGSSALTRPVSPPATSSSPSSFRWRSQRPPSLVTLKEKIF